MTRDSAAPPCPRVRIQYAGDGLDRRPTPFKSEGRGVQRGDWPGRPRRKAREKKTRPAFFYPPETRMAAHKRNSDENKSEE